MIPSSSSSFSSLQSFQVPMFRPFSSFNSFGSLSEMLQPRESSYGMSQNFGSLTIEPGLIPLDVQRDYKI